jgi:hypothetical protein
MCICLNYSKWKWNWYLVHVGLVCTLGKRRLSAIAAASNQTTVPQWCGLYYTHFFHPYVEVKNLSSGCNCYWCDNSCEIERMCSPIWNRFLVCLMSVLIILRNGFWNWNVVDIIVPHSSLHGTRFWRWCCIQFRCLEMWYCVAAWVHSKCWEPLAQWHSITSGPSFCCSVALLPPLCLASLRKRLYSSLCSAHLLHPRIPRICDASLWMTPSHLLLGFPTSRVLWHFPLRTFFWRGGILSSFILITWPSHSVLLILISSVILRYLYKL